MSSTVGVAPTHASEDAHFSDVTRSFGTDGDCATEWPNAIGRLPLLRARFGFESSTAI